ncbi:MAG: biotin--[acetyl-CoA-carboxylase] ligase [Bacteroidia bacterium]
MSNFRFTLKELERVESTNNYLRELDFKSLNSGFCILAEYQTQGKGQRGKTWNAAPGENLTFSFFLELGQLPPSHQFKLLQLVSLSVLNTVNKLTGLKSNIKWPNDIMVNRCKVAGILIENFIQQGKLKSIIGIGINVNQIEFDNYLPKATSLRLLTNEIYNTKLVLSLFEHEFSKCYNKLMPGHGELEQAYRNELYAMGEMHDFETSDGQYMVAEVLGVDRFGRLILNVDGHPKAFLNGEIRWLF